MAEADKNVPPESNTTITRRMFLGSMAGLAAFGLPLDRALAQAGGPLALHRDPRYARRGFGPFPELAATGVYGIGTYGLTDGDLVLEALRSGARLIDTSPDYRDGEVETSVGWAVQQFHEPMYLVTQIPVEDWEDTHRRVAFQRSLRRSLGRLRRGDVEALLIRNAEPWQLTDPDFRAFAEDVKTSKIVQSFGASGHGPDLEKILEQSLDDDLIEIILFGTHLANFQTIPELLKKAHGRGKRLIAIKTREAALWRHLPGWEEEATRRRDRPWDDQWQEDFSRRALKAAVETTGADQALVSIRRPEDLSLLRP
jgi:aryl-alcohol dehydrogenase-like predicted oxidoreductase